MSQPNLTIVPDTFFIMLDKRKDQKQLRLDLYALVLTSKNFQHMVKEYVFRKRPDGMILESVRSTNRKIGILNRQERRAFRIIEDMH